MIDERIRELEREAAQSPYDEVALERLDRAYRRAGQTSLRSMLHERLVTALIRPSHCLHAFSPIPSLNSARIRLPFWRRDLGPDSQHFVGRLLVLDVRAPASRDLALCCRCALVVGAGGNGGAAEVGDVLHPDRCRYAHLSPALHGLPPAAWMWPGQPHPAYPRLRREVTVISGQLQTAPHPERGPEGFPFPYFDARAVPLCSTATTLPDQRRFIDRLTVEVHNYAVGMTVAQNFHGGVPWRERR